MAVRRKAPRRRARKSFNVSAVELGTALSLSESTGAAQAVQTALSGNIFNKSFCVNLLLA